MTGPNIIWLASYPKSGNTWFRAFLTALLNPGSTGIDINNMHPATIASSRQLFDEITGVSSADLLPEEIDRLRPFVYRQNALESDELLYHKIHDAWRIVPGGEPLVPADVTRGVLYFIRNPLDVAVSFAGHLHATVDKTIGILNNRSYAFCDSSDRLPNQLRQGLSSWSGHVASWLDQSGLPVCLLRYEDMLSSPVETFSKAVSFIGIPHTELQVQQALDAASFERLKKQEDEKGFAEKNARSPSFFRKGVAGDWRNVLTAEQVKSITGAHEGVMRRFGYLRNE
jgi:hypothetical protein